MLREQNVEIVDFRTAFLRVAKGRAVVVDGPDRVSVDEFVSRQYRAEGYEVEFMESRPFHALFATFMWIVIEDYADPRTRIVGFGARPGTAVEVDRGMTWAIQPDDFGSKGYGVRRREAIDSHLADIPNDRREWLWLFDYQFGHSHRLREYLGAYDSDVVRRARLLVEILEPESLRRVLQYLTTSYWERYLGWPDLLVFRRSGEYFLVEVKGSGDQLSDDQKNWIVGNATMLRLPFKLARIHRDRVIEG